MRSGACCPLCSAHAQRPLHVCPAMQVVLDQLWAEHGEDPEAWPKEVVASLLRRNAELARQVGGHRGAAKQPNELPVSRPGGHEG